MHFTHESQYFFELAPNDALRANFTDPSVVVETAPDAREAQQVFWRGLSDKPAWFAPKSPETYFTYHGKPPQEDYRLLVDRVTVAIFITDREGM